MPRPVHVISNISYSSHTIILISPHRSVHNMFHKRSLPFGISIEIKDFFPLWNEITEMPLLPRIFLSNLKLHQMIGMFQCAKQRRYRFSNLKIHRSILDLQHYIIIKSAIQWFEMIIRCSGPICLTVTPILLAVIYETTPNHDSAKRLQCFSQHISAIGMVTPVSEWPRSIF
ncbi:hypothetical protein D3C75_646890 [compost metagenome]